MITASSVCHNICEQEEAIRCVSETAWVDCRFLIIYTVQKVIMSKRYQNSIFLVNAMRFIYINPQEPPLCPPPEATLFRDPFKGLSFPRC